MAMTDLDRQEREGLEAWAKFDAMLTDPYPETRAFVAGYRAALAAREEPQADSLIDFPEGSLEALRDLVMPLEEMSSSDRLLRLIDKALEVKRRGL
jgi:hypothetical protein